MVSSGKPHHADHRFMPLQIPPFHPVPARIWPAPDFRRGVTPGDTDGPEVGGPGGIPDDSESVGCFGQTFNTYPPALPGGGAADSARGNRILF